jgi:hypothetical protein
MMTRIVGTCICFMLPVLTTGCLAGDDAAVKVTGIFVDQGKSPYTDCTLTVTYRGRIIEQSRVSGQFQETIVFSPTTGDPLVVVGKCAGARGVYKTQINEMPKSFGEPIAFGEVVLESLDPKNR